MEKKLASAQGTIEYLVILAVIVVVGLVVVTLIINSASGGENVSSGSSELGRKLGNSEILILDAAADSDGDMVLVLQNAGLSTLSFDSIQGSEINGVLTLSGVNSYFVESDCICEEGQETVFCKIEITYITPEGLEKRLSQEAEIDCVEDITDNTGGDTIQEIRYYLDSDQDGYGDPSNYVTEPTEGYVSNQLDCDDSNPHINPDAIEICDGIDSDCDGDIDSSCECFIGQEQSCSPCDIGSCTEGIQICDNGTWDLCIGSSTPLVANFDLGYARLQEYGFQRYLIGKNGDRYVLGRAFGTVKMLGDYSIDRPDLAYDSFIWVLDVYGNEKALLETDGSGTESINRGVITSNRDLIITGSMNSSTNFGGQAIPYTSSSYGGFMSKIVGDSVNWIISSQGGTSLGMSNVYLDDYDNIYTYGTFRGNTTLGGVSMVNGGTNNNGYVAKISNGGNVEWIITTNSVLTSSVKRFVVLPDGSSYVVIEHQDTVNFGGEIIDATQAVESLVRINSDGVVVGSVTLESTNSEDFDEVIFDNQGNGYFLAKFSSADATIGDYYFPGPYSGWQFLYGALDSQMNIKWVKHLKDTGIQGGGYHLHVLPNGNILADNFFSSSTGSADFNGISLNQYENYGMFFAEIDSSGNILNMDLFSDPDGHSDVWLQRYETNGGDFAYAGDVSGNSTLNGELISSETDSGFFIKYYSGNFSWEKKGLLPNGTTFYNTGEGSSNGAYFSVRYTEDFNIDDEQFIATYPSNASLIKMNSSGEIEWKKSMGGLDAAANTGISFYSGNPNYYSSTLGDYGLILFYDYSSQDAIIEGQTYSNTYSKKFYFTEINYSGEMGNIKKVSKTDTASLFTVGILVDQYGKVTFVPFSSGTVYFEDVAYPEVGTAYHSLIISNATE